MSLLELIMLRRRAAAAEHPRPPLRRLTAQQQRCTSRDLCYPKTIYFEIRVGKSMY